MHRLVLHVWGVTKPVWFKQPCTQTHFALNLRYKGEAHTHLSYHCMHCEAFSQLRVEGLAHSHLELGYEAHEAHSQLRWNWAGFALQCICCIWQPSGHIRLQLCTVRMYTIHVHSLAWLRNDEIMHACTVPGPLADVTSAENQFPVQYAYTCNFLPDQNEDDAKITSVQPAKTMPRLVSLTSFCVVMLAWTSVFLLLARYFLFSAHEVSE